MNQTLHLCQLELKETFRARWYQFYLLTVVSMITLFFYFGLVESTVMGFTGLGRMLLTLIQASIIILPILVMLTTVRTLVGDKETGVWEYNLSIPVKLSAFYWGRGLGKFFSLFFPLMLGMFLVGTIASVQGHSVSWNVIALYVTFMASNLLFFTGLALFISVFSINQEMAIGLGFVLWLIFEGLIDALLLGMMLKYRFLSDTVLGLAFLNPLQAFRMASIALFDPELTILGPIAYSIIEKIGLRQLLLWAALWPSFLGLFWAFIGFVGFKKRDLI